MLTALENLTLRTSAVAVTFLALPTVAFAELFGEVPDIGGVSAGSTDEIRSGVLDILDVVLSFMALIAVIFIVIAGIRLQSMLSDRRTVLGQRIATESGRALGVCRDVQFNTETFLIEWLFPKRFFRWGIALPVAEVKEITPRAIIIRDPMVREEKKASTKEPVEGQQGVDVTIPTPTT